MSLKKHPLTWYLVIGCFVGVFAQIALLIFVGPSWLLGSDDDSAPPSDRSSADTGAARADEPTPYLRMVAHELESDPVWVDPLLAGSTGQAWIDDQVRSAVEGSSTPVFVAVIAHGGSDGSGGDLALTAARLATAVDREGVFYLIAGDRVEIFESVAAEEIRPEPGFFASQSGTELAASVRSIDDVSEDDSGSGVADQIAGGLFLGAPWLVVGWFVSRWIARAARRNTDYMEGFG